MILGYNCTMSTASMKLPPSHGRTLRTQCGISCCRTSRATLEHPLITKTPLRYQVQQHYVAKLRLGIVWCVSMTRIAVGATRTKLMSCCEMPHAQSHFSLNARRQEVVVQQARSYRPVLYLCMTVGM